MQHSFICNQEFPPSFFKYVEVNGNQETKLKPKNFLNGLKNARNLLKDLESSLQKSRKYEKQLEKCKSKHCSDALSSINDWWDSDKKTSKYAMTDTKKLETSRASITKSSRSQVNLAESWSTMSIVCLQYQYEELLKRYESLLEAYDKRSSSLTRRESAMARLQRQARMCHRRLSDAHTTLLVVGKKYLALRDKRIAQRIEYEGKLQLLMRTVHEVLAATEKARMDLDDQISNSMTMESDAATSLLLAEIRKCNMLYLENLRLKSQIEELAPGTVVWQ